MTVYIILVFRFVLRSIAIGSHPVYLLTIVLPIVSLNFENRFRLKNFDKP